MAWVVLGTQTTGTPAPVLFANEVIGDLNLLASSVGLLGAGTALVGSTPASLVPGNLKMQAAAVSGTTSGFNLAVTFPVSFAAGVLVVLITPANGTNGTWAFNVSASSTTGFTLETNVSTSSIAFSYLAIGF